MAFKYRFNFPIMELEIAKENIMKMTNDNSLRGDDNWKDEEKFCNNIKYGFITATALISCFDGVLSYFIKNICKCPIRNRIENIKSIYHYSKHDYHEFLNSSNNIEFKKLIDARNGLIHFEKYELGYSGNLGNITIKDVSFDSLFTKTSMQKHYDNILFILHHFASMIGADVDFTIKFITYEGMIGRADFINII